MNKPDFDDIKDLTLNAFFQYMWKRIEREHRAIEQMIEGDGTYDTKLLIESMERYNRWIDGLEIYFSALSGEIPIAFGDLEKDFMEHNSNPSGTEGLFFKRIPVSA